MVIEAKAVLNFWFNIIIVNGVSINNGVYAGQVAIYRIG
jgi:hypothetical protein